MNMAGKILACSLLLVLHIAISLFGGFILMVGINGFHGGNIPTIGFLFYFIWTIVTAIILVALSYFGVGFIADKNQINQYSAAVIAIVISMLFQQF
jgi:uncharacterized membrane-anchored protein